MAWGRKKSGGRKEPLCGLPAALADLRLSPDDRIPAATGEEKPKKPVPKRKPEADNEDEPPLNEVLSRLSPCDLVIIEGYKREGHAKIEVRRSGARESIPISDSDPSIIALVTDMEDGDTTLPRFELDDVDAVTGFVMDRFPLEK